MNHLSRGPRFPAVLQREPRADSHQYSARDTVASHQEFPAAALACEEEATICRRIGPFLLYRVHGDFFRRRNLVVQQPHKKGEFRTATVAPDNMSLHCNL